MPGKQGVGRLDDKDGNDESVAIVALANALLDMSVSVHDDYLVNRSTII